VAFSLSCLGEKVVVPWDARREVGQVVSRPPFNLTGNGSSHFLLHLFQTPRLAEDDRVITITIIIITTFPQRKT